MGRRRGRVVRLGDAVLSLAKRADRSGGLLRARAVDVWDEAVGPEIARHTRVTAARSRVLEVHVDSHAWAAQLRLMSEELLDRVNSALGETPVRAIRFTVSRAVEDERTRDAAEERSVRRYGGKKVVPAELTDEEMAEIERSVPEVNDQALREAAIRARARDRQVKKALEEEGDRQG